MVCRSCPISTQVDSDNPRSDGPSEVVRALEEDLSRMQAERSAPLVARAVEGRSRRGRIGSCIRRRKYFDLPHNVDRASPKRFPVLADSDEPFKTKIQDVVSTVPAAPDELGARQVDVVPTTAVSTTNLRRRLVIADEEGRSLLRPAQ